MNVSKKSHLEQINTRMNQKLEEYPPFVLEKLFLVYKSQNLTELKEKFEKKDKAGPYYGIKTGLVLPQDFFSILEDIVMLTDKQKQMLTNALVINGRVEDGIPYNEFMNSVNISSDENLQKIRKKFLVEFNDYLLVLSENIRVNNLNCKDIWIEANKGSPKIDKNGFRNFLNNPKLNSGKFENIFNDEDKDYLFSIISSNGTELSFKDFDISIKNILGNEVLARNTNIPQNVDEVINILKDGLPNNINQGNGNTFSFKEENKFQGTNAMNQMENNMNNNISNNMNNNMNNNINNNMNNNINNISNNMNNNMNNNNNNMDNSNVNKNNINNTNNNLYNNLNNNITNNNINNNTNNNMNNNMNNNINNNTNNNMSNNINNTNLNPNNVTTTEASVNEAFKNYIQHPFRQIRSQENFIEIQNSGDQLFFIIQNRFKAEKDKITDILKFHQKYTVLKLYYRIFYCFQSLHNEPLLRFQAKDPEQKLLIGNFEFYNVLNSFNLNITPEEFKLIVNSLNFKTDKLSSYDEFLKKVRNIQNIENNELRLIFHDCNYYFNDYLYDFRHYIIDNKIDYRNAYLKTCGSMTSINFDYFSKFLNEIGYKLTHEEEEKYLYSNLCDNNYLSDNVNINTNEFLFRDILFDRFLQLKDITEIEFLNTGILSVEKKNNNEWRKNIKQFTDNTKELYIENYKHLKQTFLNIKEKCVSYCVENLTDFLDKHGDISPEGDILTEQFINIMTTIGISQNLNFDSLLNKFKYTTGPKKGIYFQLAEFLSIYYLFTNENDNNSNNNNKFGFEEENNINTTEAVPDQQNPKKDTNANYVYKNAHRNFTQDDINYISELSTFIADIIIDEKNDSVTNFWRNNDKYQEGYITIEKFKKILEEDLQIAVDGDDEDAENMKIFLDFVVDDKQIQGNDIIKITRIIQIIKGYSGKDQPQNKQINFGFEQAFQGTNAGNVNDDKSKLNNSNNANIRLNNIDPNQSVNSLLNSNIITSTPFEKIISDFAHYLNNHRIKFNSIFPSINLERVISNQTITGDELKSGFQNANFPLSYENYQNLMQHFDSNSKNIVKVDDLKSEISKFEPQYFEQEFQKSDNNHQQRQQLFQSGFSMNSQGNAENNKILNGIGKIMSYLDYNKISPVAFFNGKFRQGENNQENIYIQQNQFIEALCPKDNNTLDAIPNLTIDEVELIYKVIDKSQTNQVPLEDIIKFFGDNNIAPLNINERNSLVNSIDNEINLLFNIFDVTRSGRISKEQFYKCLKSVDHKAVRRDADYILMKYSTINPNEISKNDFTQIMFKYIEKQLVIQREEKDYMVNLLKEVDVDNNGYLSKSQMKYILRNKINCNLSDNEIDDLLNKLDAQNEDKIEIREFVSLLDNINTNNSFNSSKISMNDSLSVMNVNMNLNMYRNIRPKDFVSLYSDLPILFIPSFIREEQQKLNLLPSSFLKPLTKNDTMYEDITPVENLIYNDKDYQGRQLNVNNINGGGAIQTYRRLASIKTEINGKISFPSYATGVCSPDETLFENVNSKYKIVGRQLKIALFNKANQRFIGNAVSIDCVYKKEYQDRWYFETDRTKWNNNIIIRYNKSDFKSIDIIFEFVLVIQKKIENQNYTLEVSCGWCKAPMEWLKYTKDEDIPIYGGTPLRKENINEYDVRTRRIGFFPKLGACFSGAVRSELRIRVKEYMDLNKIDKLYIDYLPSLIVCHRAAIHMISIYRQIIGEYILNHKDFDIKYIKNENNLCNTFCKIADVPDAFRIMNELWLEIVMDGGPFFERNTEAYQRENFKKFVNRVNTVLYAESFKYNPKDPTELPRGDIKLMQDRDILVNSVLRNDTEDFNKLGYKSVENYSFKPFTMDEVNGQKELSILKKLDDFANLMNNSNTQFLQ